ncbi:MAG TPA: hypothetical protein VM911_22545 [Pyrinomonadaceae bacterium]|jgi:hypothetical protein|nr:hypothetical protein [Pyrinomonadaceae bacterium]
MTRHKVFQAAVIIFLTCACTTLAAAQEGWGTPTAPAERPVQPQQQPQPQTVSSDSTERTQADETFELNIAERRITERDFAASTSVEAGEESARGLKLRVGVEVGASSIDVLLRNVRGSVRFRATLERVLERLNARRTQTDAPAAAPATVP